MEVFGAQNEIFLSKFGRVALFVARFEAHGDFFRGVRYVLFMCYGDFPDVPAH